MSSHDIVVYFRRFLKTRKIGHSGTLDPAACGLLLLAIGEGTKFLKFFNNDEKEYKFTIKFGVKTDTADCQGNIIDKNEKRPKLKEVKEVLSKFIGTINQTPTKFSAIKINGVRAYELARNGCEFEMPTREVQIKKLDLISYELCQNCEFEEDVFCCKKFDQTSNIQFDDSPKLCEKVTLIARCSAGTYIRTLAEDIANELGCIGYVSFLQRIGVGKFTLEDIKRTDVHIENKEVEGKICNDFSAQRYSYFVSDFAYLDFDIIKNAYENFALNGAVIQRLLHGQRVRIEDNCLKTEDVKTDILNTMKIMANIIENMPKIEIDETQENNIKEKEKLYAATDCEGNFVGMIGINERGVIFPICMIKQ